MKYLAATVATLLGIVDATTINGANKSFSRKLMQNAKPVKKAGRKLQDDFELTASHSIIFSSCETLSVQIEDDDRENEENEEEEDDGYNAYNSYMKSAAVGQKSYIIFDVCLTEYCYSGNDNYRTTFVTDMASYISAFSEFIPTKKQNYCEACAENYEVCFQQNWNYDPNQNGQDGGARRTQENGVQQELDCGKCQAWGCFSNENYADYTPQWIQSLAECQQSEVPYYYQGEEVFMGFMCNDDGTGVEIAAFLDEDCISYTNEIAFGNVMSSNDYQYWLKSKQYIQYMFNTGFNCYDPEVTYTNPYANYNYNGNDDEEADEEEDEEANNDDAEVAEWCQMAFEGENGVANMYDCYDEDNESEDEDEDEDEANNYGYSLNEEDADDMDSVCAILVKKGGEGDHVYDKSGSGTMYKYQGTQNQEEQSSENWEEELERESRQENTAIMNAYAGKAALALFLLLLVAAGAGGIYYLKKQEEVGDKKEPMLQAESTGELA